METKLTIPLIKKSSSYKIVIPANVETQIRFLCARVWDTEWSGVLFYTPSGNFEDGSLEIHCVDILPMDVGTTTYTEFDMSPDVISYMAANQELLDCKMGLIHSHNNMSTFFSGTDLATLREEGADRNHFVSLIVNNAGKYTAAITRKIKYHSVRELSYDGFNGVVNLNDKQEVDGQEIEYFDLEIVFEEEHDSKLKEIADRISEIKEEKRKSSKPAVTGYTPTYSAPGYTSPYTPKTTTNIYDSPYKTPTLFDDVDWGYKKPEKPAETKEKNPFAKTPILEDQKANDSDIDKIVNQLITGSVTVTNLDADAKKKLLKTMVTRFDKRFGGDDDGISMMLFNYWATDFIEFLVWYSIPGDNNEDEVAEEVALKLIEALDKLPANKYINEYKEILETYVAKF